LLRLLTALSTATSTADELLLARLLLLDSDELPLLLTTATLLGLLL
jgi:hypothetical protein